MITNREIFLVLTLTFAIKSMAAIDVYTGYQAVDNQSYHMPSFSVFEIDSSFYNIADSKWSLTANPEILYVPIDDKYDYSVTDLSVSRSFKFANSHVMLGKTSVWYLGEMLFQAGAAYTMNSINYKRQLKLETGILTKFQDDKEVQLGKISRISYIEQSIDGVTIKVSPFIYDQDQDEGQDKKATSFGVEGNLIFALKSFTIASAFKTFSSGNSGESLHISTNNSSLFYKRPIAETITVSDDNDIINTFPIRDTRWVGLTTSKFNQLLFIKAQYDLVREEHYLLTVSSKIKSFGPYVNYLKIPQSRIIIGGITYDYQSILNFDLGGGSEYSVKRERDITLLHASLRGKIPIGKNDNINIKVKFHANDWIDYDSVASVYYHFYY